MSVSTVREEYGELLPEVQRNQAASIGQRAIKAGKTKYLYPIASMIGPDGNLTPDGQSDYDVMLKRTLFLNATGRTIDGLSGLVFMKPHTLELPEQLQYLVHNVDGSQNSLRKSMEVSLRHNCIAPWSGLLVDHPEVEGQVSRAQQEELNIRPKIIRYDFQQIINWDYSTVNNERRLSLLVLVETQNIRINKFETEKKTFHRVLELIDGIYHHSLYEEESLITPPTPVLVNGATTDRIPFFWIRAGHEHKALLSDLVDVNINHYNMNASYTNKEFVSGFPVFTGTGISNDELPSGIGPGCFWYSESPEASYGILESSADGGSLRQYLEDRKLEMAALGADMLSPDKMAAETAESKRLDKQAQNSVLASLATEVGEAYKMALMFCAMWLGVSGEIKLQLNTNYETDAMTAQDRTAYMQLTMQGLYPLEALYETLNKAGDIPEGMSFDDYKNLIRDDFGVGGMPDVSGGE